MPNTPARCANQRLLRGVRKICSMLAMPAAALLSPAAHAAIDSTQVDSDLVALWLFDEPHYMNMTLTDAGVAASDLRLLPGGRLIPGRYGNALSISAEAGPAADLAKGPNRNDIGLVNSIASRVPDARPVTAPTQVLETLAGPAWTLELWIKLKATPETVATVFEVGHGTTAHFSCVLEGGGTGFRLLLPGGKSLRCPADAALLGDGNWHHLAFTSEGGDGNGKAGGVTHWLDGHQQPQAEAMGEPPVAAAERPGLVGVAYADGARKWPVSARVSGKADFYEGVKTLFSAVSYAQTWRGQLRSPADGEVEFSIQSENSVAFSVDGQKIIDARTSATRARGTARLERGKLHACDLTFEENGGDTAVRLEWRLPGQAWATVPEGAFVHTRDDLETAWREVKGFAGELAKADSIPGWEWERLSWPRPEGSPPVKPDIARIAEGIAERPYLTLGGETLEAGGLDAEVDELRISRAARYSGQFTPPASFSRNASAEARKPTEPTGPPLLFAGTHPTGPIELGSRKHLFLDDKLIDARAYLQLRPQPPTQIEPTDLANDKPWEHPTAGAFGDTNFYDHEGEIRLTYLNNAVWEEPDTTHTVCLATSRDGLHFTKPELGLHSWEGSRANNILFNIPLQGRIFKDTRPGIPADELFKCSGYVIDRGIFLFTSPDGIHWRRNETIMLPFDSGGGVEMFWDDQRGLYNCYLRHEGWVFMREPYGRAAALSQTREPFKPWPFKPMARPIPRYESWALPSVCEELPTPFVPYPQRSTKDPNVRIGQVYRTRAVKYEWAPDTYVAFDYRLFGSPIQSEESRKTELAVSRDGENWQLYREPFYYDNAWEYEGNKVVECLAVDGLTRRGDELWQYIMVKFRSHALWSDHDRIFRTRQRLDGFVAVETTGRPGSMRTYPLTFSGARLELNLISKGATRVGLLDEVGNDIPGYTLQDCDPIQADSVRQVVTWGGKDDVSALSGRVVRLQFAMEDTHLYAFQFVAN